MIIVVYKKLRNFLKKVILKENLNISKVKKISKQNINVLLYSQKKLVRFLIKILVHLLLVLEVMEQVILVKKHKHLLDLEHILQ